MEHLTAQQSTRTVFHCAGLIYPYSGENIQREMDRTINKIFCRFHVDLQCRRACTYDSLGYRGHDFDFGSCYFEQSLGNIVIVIVPRRYL